MTAGLAYPNLLSDLSVFLKYPAGHAICCVFRFKEVFYDETYLAIVMEYASQGHLSSLLKRQGKLSETDARRYVRNSHLVSRSLLSACCASGSCNMLFSACCIGDNPVAIALFTCPFVDSATCAKGPSHTCYQPTCLPACHAWQDSVTLTLR